MPLTVISQKPLPLGEYLSAEKFELLFRRPVTGHFAVTRSLLRGLKLLREAHTFNPPVDFLNYPDVVVLADVAALRHYIQLKKKGKIRKLFAGPNLVVRSNEENSILASDYIDKVIVPSEWVKNAYVKDTPEIAGKVAVWAAGVNEEEFTAPENPIKRFDYLVYLKSDEKEIAEEVKKRIATAGYNFAEISYGDYSKEQYREQLKASRFLLFISRSESQGLALAEAWAMDVPTIVWDPGEVTIKGMQYENPSSCPYLTEKTGLRFRDAAGFSAILEKLNEIKNGFSPRRWLLENMTDKLAAVNLLKIFETT